MTKSGKSRGWCFTINNYDDDDIARCMATYEISHDNGRMQYLILGFEVGEKGTKHIQGYMYFKNPIHKNVARNLFPRSHVEDQKSTSNIAAYVYCMEDMDYYEMGKRPRQGVPGVLEVIKYDLKNGVPMKKVANDYFPQWCQYRRAFDEFKMLDKEKYDTKLIAYDPLSHTSIEKMYEIYDKDKDWIVIGVLVAMEIIHTMKTGKYRYIFTEHSSQVLDNYLTTIDRCLDLNEEVSNEEVFGDVDL